MSQINIIRNFIQNVGAIILGVVGFGSSGLIIPYTLGQYLGIKKQSSTLKSFINRIFNVSNKEMYEVMTKHKKFPIFSMLAMLANSFSYSSITIFMETLFDMATVGYYSMSTRILGLPLSLVSGNIAKVFLKKLQMNI